MDIVLEICDYYLFDRVYAKVLPASTQLPDVFASKLKIASAPFQFSTGNGTDTTSTFISEAVKFVGNTFSNMQREDEIYGLPRYLPESIYTNASLLPRSNLLREGLSMFLVTAIFGWVLYFTVAYLSYIFVFDKKIFNHPRYLKNQIYLEIERASTAIPVMVLLTLPFFLLEINGFSKLYMDINESTGGWKAIWTQIPCFILFTDCFIYLIHRWLHWPSVYKRLHKPHHKWIVCTPFASHAFHPVDGFFQSLPYHWFPFMFPLHKVSYLLLFTFVNFWTVMIHDGQYLSNDPFVNGTACHTVHHLYFNYNYGQFTTLWDRIGNSYRRPDDNLFVKDTKTSDDKKVWAEQTVQMETIRGELEGKDDDRVYK
ncbi:delta(7)-sterol 5(6)-desaturase [[Candida] anglica]|uniref:Delta(7)-sterol 5(6)-desaturase n=1 Tax=[Candida] anglica TaxID=148631 RepID=A0ABP0EMK8_9ASCO